MNLASAFSGSIRLFICNKPTSQTAVASALEVLWELRPGNLALAESIPSGDAQPTQDHRVDSRFGENRFSHGFLGNRIAIVGNAGGGKTALAREMGRILALPVTHVDSIQYRSGWRRTPKLESDRVLTAIALGDRWIIDGFGSDDVIESRVDRADSLVFIDFPLWRHYWWALKRQLAARKGQRRELPDDCPEFNLAYTRKLIQVMWTVHQEYTPWFRALAKIKSTTGKVVVIRHPRDTLDLISAIETDNNNAPSRAGNSIS